MVSFVNERQLFVYAQGDLLTKNLIRMSKRCELQKEYYQAHGNYKGEGKYCDKYVSWLEEQILALRIHDVVGRSEQFNCLGGNHAKGIKPCSEWCGEDMCQKPSN